MPDISRDTLCHVTRNHTACLEGILRHEDNAEVLRKLIHRTKGYLLSLTAMKELAERREGHEPNSGN